MLSKEERKQKLIKDVIEMLGNKASENEVKEYLKKQGMNFYDIDHIMIQADKDFLSQYATKVNNLLLEGKNDTEIMTVFTNENIGKEYLETLIKREKKTIIHDSGNKLHKLIKEDTSEIEAVKMTINPIFTEQEALKKLRYIAMVREEEKNDKADGWSAVISTIRTILGI